MNEVHTTDNELHDLITPTCEEQDDRYGTTRPKDEDKFYFDEDRFETCNCVDNDWGDW
jgi:hypothetical protein